MRRAITYQHIHIFAHPSVRVWRANVKEGSILYIPGGAIVFDRVIGDSNASGFKVAFMDGGKVALKNFIDMKQIQDKLAPPEKNLVSRFLGVCLEQSKDVVLSHGLELKS